MRRSTYHPHDNASHAGSLQDTFEADADTVVLFRAKYRMGRTLGAGTYGIVREADCPIGKVAVKIILKKNVKGNEQMVYDELEMLQRMKHPHIVRFVDWFESKVGLPSFGLDIQHTNISV